MAGLTMTDANEILKRDYLPLVRNQIPTKTPYLNRVKKGSEDVVGEEARISLRTERNEGVGARGNGEALPTAGSNKYKQIGVPTKNVYGRMEVPGKLFKAARNNRGAFLRAVEAELKGVVESLQWDTNRQLMGDGVGKLATVAAAANTTTFTVNGSLWSTKMRHIRKNMRVDIYSSDGLAARATDRLITSVDLANNQFTVDGANLTTQANDIVVRAGALDDELGGLAKIFANNNTLYGIDRSLAANAWFRTQVLSNPAGAGTLRSISEVLIQQGIDESEIQAGGTITLMLSTHGVRRAYQEILSALKRYTEPKRLSGGWTALDYNGIDWVADPDCPQNKLRLLDESTYKLHTMIDEIWEWGEEDGQVLRQVSGYDAYEAFMVMYAELVCDTPAKNVEIQDITEK